MAMSWKFFKIALVGAALLAEPAFAGITVSPYVSIRSTKTVKPAKKEKGSDEKKETETIKQRQEAGLRAGLTFFRLFNLGLSVGQSKLTTTEKISNAKDEYGEIDYEKDLDMKTDNPDNEIKITETQRNARLTVGIDPGFWIFILRAKAGVIATQRILDTEQSDGTKMNITAGPTYKATSGFGFGVRFTPRMYAMAEYNMFHYKYPEIEPFEREVAVSYAIEF
jgi:hypothetical protein